MIISLHHAMPIDEYRAVDVFVSDRNQIARTHGSVSKQIANDSGVNGFEYVHLKLVYPTRCAVLVLLGVCEISTATAQHSRQRRSALF